MVRKMIFLAMLAALSAADSLPATEINDAYKERLNDVIEANMNSWLEQYKDFHMHPELGLEEVRSASILAKEMRKLGFDVTGKVGKTGVVAIYKNGDGPVVMIRADMDALPVKEATGLPYASNAKAMYNGEETPLMHACGHDIHMTAWLGTAKALVSMKDKWKGTLMFVAQPAEEGRGGAKAMMDDHIFERFGIPDHAFALHVMPGPYDSVLLVKGAFSSYAGGFQIKFNGRGGHGSMPNTTIDPIMMAGKFINDVQTVVSREKDPQEFGVISVGMVSAGKAGNVIPDSATLAGTVRWYDPKVGEKLLSGIERTAESIVSQVGAPSADINIVGSNEFGAVINDPELFDETQKAFEMMPNEMRTLVGKPITASEDYGLFLKDFKSSVYFAVGSMDPSLFDKDGKPLDITKVPSNHSPFFAPVPEPTLRTAVTAMTTAVYNVMN